ncbi:hypothetical protein EJ08DRAFT_731453 [Tothia fuscella]|uniref:DUF4484 domain-containing protein n=1 Tax=Tothia fuscella TaxID=1048955 RepID=A0A9P4U0E1_9PEZI|nr:hypothetical protein EJ08DRAFT_731453 [Tothia fuscella]
MTSNTPVQENDNGYPKPQEDSPPPLAALFLIKFDLKVGYTIAWKKSLDSVPLEGIVEYKSLPSGLHNVKEDLVYFVHEKYAGISAFMNTPAGSEERNAQFIAVGAMVKLGDGRLGRAWEHAGELKALAKKLVHDTADVSQLEGYWKAHRLAESDEAESSEPQLSPYTASQKRTRALSSLTLSPTTHKLPPYHPAHSILDYLDTFGPLTFPLHRAALLRKRILFVTPAPVKLTCEYVYDLSILSSLPLSLSSSLPLPSPSFTRLRPLFNIGIHDIPYLSSYSGTYPSASSGHPIAAEDEPINEEHGVGWIGCTTDEILAMKPDLYDILVELPQPDRKQPTKSKAKRKEGGIWPVIKYSKTGVEIKATQRDLRRYKLLRQALSPLSQLRHGLSAKAEDADDDDELTHLLFHTNDSSEDGDTRTGEDKLAEPTSWSALAYGSFIFWASAGEKEEGLAEEEEQDHKILADLGETVRTATEAQRYHDSDEEGEDSQDRLKAEAEVEMGVIAYFHRVSKQLFEACVEVLDERSGTEGDEDARGDEEVVEVGSTELRRCGLDVWSEADRDFLSDLVEIWFERAVEIHGIGVDLCGVRIC